MNPFVYQSLLGRVSPAVQGLARKEFFGPLLMAILLALPLSVAQAQDTIDLSAVSTRPDMVTGGDVLVRVTLPDDIARDGVVVELNGEDVTGVFEPDEVGSLLGLVEGLEEGENTLTARANGDASAQLTLINHPRSGPVLSGPQQQPFLCETEAWGLGAPLDQDCSAPTQVRYLYRSSAGGLLPLHDLEARPADLVQTTTSEGNTVDFIVRHEIGTINRAVYEIATLYDPTQPEPDPLTPSDTWNGRLVYTFGGGCNAGFHQGRETGGVLDDTVLAASGTALSKGYALASATLNVNNNGGCYDALSAETLMMVKEHFIETYGNPVYTIGWGASGGAMQQYLIAQNYPGLLDGIIAGLTYPDAITYLSFAQDCRLLANYFADAADGEWTFEQQTAVAGTSTWDTCDSRVNRPARINPTEGFDEAIPEALYYNADRNPGGLRYTMYEQMRNSLGVDPETGFARSPWDNVGIQYGLEALNEGSITPEQFLDLNERIGGFDIDANIIPERTSGDLTAIRNAYESGRVNTGGGGLAEVPIIDVRMYLDDLGDIHDFVQSFVVRERLEAANGNADNHVIIVVPRGVENAYDSEIYQELSEELLGLMDEWLQNISQAEAGDTENAALAVAENRPDELVDACYTAAGEKIAEPASRDGTGQCNELYPVSLDTRTVAGAPLTNDVFKCELKPVSSADYAVEFTPEQRERLSRIFPGGVCDWAQPGVGQSAIRDTWLSFGEDEGSQ